MITSQQAEKLAKKHMADYVNSCGCQTPEDVANVLMKLASVCGIAMCATVGCDDAADRLQGTSDYIRESQMGISWKEKKAN